MCARPSFAAPNTPKPGHECACSYSGLGVCAPQIQANQAMIQAHEVLVSWSMMDSDDLGPPSLMQNTKRASACLFCVLCMRAPLPCVPLPCCASHSPAMRPTPLPCPTPPEATSQATDEQPPLCQYPLPSPPLCQCLLCPCCSAAEHLHCRH